MPEVKVFPVPEARGTKPRYDYHRTETYYAAVRDHEHRAPCDIYARQGADVVSMTDGVVWSTKNGGDWGQQVRVEAPSGRTYLYAHLSRALVDVGQRVTAGQKLGEVGHSGFTRGRTGDHLHPERWKARYWVDTEDFTDELEAARTGGGGFLMSLTDEQEKAIYDGVVGGVDSVNKKLDPGREIIESLRKLVKELTDDSDENRFIARVDQKLDDILRRLTALEAKVK